MEEEVKKRKHEQEIELLDKVKKELKAEEDRRLAEQKKIIDEYNRNQEAIAAEKAFYLRAIADWDSLLKKQSILKQYYDELYRLDQECWRNRYRLAKKYWDNRSRLAKEYWDKRYRLAKEYWDKRYRLAKEYWRNRYQLDQEYWDNRYRLAKEYWNGCCFLAEKYGLKDYQQKENIIKGQITYALTQINLLQKQEQEQRLEQDQSSERNDGFSMY